MLVILNVSRCTVSNQLILERAKRADRTSAREKKNELKLQIPQENFNRWTHLNHFDIIIFDTVANFSVWFI